MQTPKEQGASKARTSSGNYASAEFQDLVNACDDADQARAMRPVFARFVHKAYDTHCPNDTARQLDAWAKNRPNLSKYLKNSTKEAA